MRVKQLSRPRRPRVTHSQTRITLADNRQIHFYKAVQSPGTNHIDDAAFLLQFEAGLWPREHWHHEQHIKIAYLYLTRYPFAEAVTRAREKIKAHNHANSVVETATSGYHETTTQAWMWLVYTTLREYGPATNADAFYKQNPQLSQKKTLRLFYSREVLTSPAAKFEFVEPDLAPLPVSAKPPPNLP